LPSRRRDAPSGRHAALLVRTLDHYPGDGRMLHFLLQHLADFDILVQQLAVLVLAGSYPTGIPTSGCAETQSDWIDILTHRSLSCALKRQPRPRPDAQRSSAAENGFKGTRPERPSSAARVRNASSRCHCRHGLGDDQIGRPSRSVLFSALAIADSRNLLTSTAIRFARKLQIGQKCGRSLLPRNPVARQNCASRAHPKHPGELHGCCPEGSSSRLVAHRISPQAFVASCRQNWPWKVRSAREPPNL